VEEGDPSSASSDNSTDTEGPDADCVYEGDNAHTARQVLHDADLITHDGLESMQAFIDLVRRKF